ncbi:helix-turn-helix domain-containing transcriptional regulator [Microcoleus vaginatus]|uniref:helix-turn-helix domain-containing transcriptional regulator n=1 Tax=Microcoleus vaginatus TaxID=119532 RepID=UPI001F609153
MLKSLPYHPFLIQSIKNPTDSAMYLEAFFEEENPEAELLKMVLSNVAEALSKKQIAPEQARINQEKLDELLSQAGSDAIYNLGTWLKALGFKLTVTVCEPENSIKRTESRSELTVYQNPKMPKSLPYRPFLIESLRKKPELAATYIETHFELDEGEEPDEALLKRALSDVAEALGQPKMTPEEYELHLKKLDELLSQQGSDAIYNLGTWLNALGLKLTVAIFTDTEDNTANAEIPAQLSV